MDWISRRRSNAGRSAVCACRRGDRFEREGRRDRLQDSVDSHRRQDDGHRPGLGFRGYERDHRTLPHVPCEGHGGARRLGGRGRYCGDADCAAEAHPRAAGSDRRGLPGCSAVAARRSRQVRRRRCRRAGGGCGCRFVCERRGGRSQHVSAIHDRRCLCAHLVPGRAPLG